MREVISVHVGQAGVQIGNACCKCPYLHELSKFAQRRGNMLEKRVDFCSFAMFGLCERGVMLIREHAFQQGSFTPSSTVLA